MSSTTLNNHAVISVPGGDARTELGQMVSGCGVFSLATRATIALTGNDRTRWLNGMITNNVRDLAVGHGVYGFLLNPQGHILGDLYAYNRGESLLVETDRSQLEKVLAAFDHYIIMDDVQVADLSEKLSGVGLAGPKASQILKAVGFATPDLGPLEFIEQTWQGRSLTLVRGDNPAIEWCELWSTGEDVAAVHEALRQAGAQAVGDQALELARIASGVPRYGQDIRERDLPQETEQHRALNFNKGCYIGQEIVERIRSRGAVHRKFIGFEVRGPLPGPGTKVQAEGRDVGELTSVAELPMPTGDRGVALGYVRRELTTSGKEFRAGETTLAVADLPFAAVFPPHNR